MTRFLVYIACSLLIGESTAFVTERWNQRHCLDGTTRRSLFFRPSEIENPKELACQELASGDIAFPYQRPHSVPDSVGSFPVLTVRLLEERDIEQVVSICVNEYSTGQNVFPWEDPSKVSRWVDYVFLRALVEVSMKLKVVKSPWQLPADHAVLLLELDDDIAGMIEVSRQPVLPERNPPAIPFPLVLKRTLCRFSGIALEGWIANLLIVRRYRGQGLSKILVAATEGVATRWGCRSMHLHCDANSDRGRIPQRLYERLGYRSVLQTDETKMDRAEGMLFSNVVFIEGMALLYLRKDI